MIRSQRLSKVHGETAGDVRRKRLQWQVNQQAECARDRIREPQKANRKESGTKQPSASEHQHKSCAIQHQRQ